MHVCALCFAVAVVAAKVTGLNADGLVGSIPSIRFLGCAIWNTLAGEGFVKPGVMLLVFGKVVVGPFVLEAHQVQVWCCVAFAFYVASLSFGFVCICLLACLFACVIVCLLSVLHILRGSLM